uniref:Uncharacterized protein n=1 Tax=Opuntia streptacantha TaxID=393608 RepID=A0A7C8YGD0_OPUST
MHQYKRCSQNINVQDIRKSWSKKTLPTLISKSSMTYLPGLISECICSEVNFANHEIIYECMQMISPVFSFKKLEESFSVLVCLLEKHCRMISPKMTVLLTLFLIRKSHKTFGENVDSVCQPAA